VSRRCLLIPGQQPLGVGLTSWQLAWATRLSWDLLFIEPEQ
jgi:hypothetical protein